MAANDASESDEGGPGLVMTGKGAVTAAAAATANARAAGGGSAEGGGARSAARGADGARGGGPSRKSSKGSGQSRGGAGAGGAKDASSRGKRKDKSAVAALANSYVSSSASPKGPFCTASGQPLHPLSGERRWRPGQQCDAEAESEGLLISSPAQPEPCLPGRQGLVQMMALEDRQRAAGRAQGVSRARCVYDAPATAWNGPPSRAAPPLPYAVSSAMSASWDAATAVQDRTIADAREAAAERRSGGGGSGGGGGGGGGGGSEANTMRHSLSFDSDFESGNLLRAVQVGPTEYDLVLRTDVHTTSYTQWFYFAVSNTHMGMGGDGGGGGGGGGGEPVSGRSRRYRFNIVNLAKPDSLFNQGMRPVMYSCKDAAQQQRGWVRCGTDICYYQNCNPKAGASRASDTYYTLTFHVSFPHGADTFLLAHTYPYTTADNRRHVAALLREPASAQWVRRSTLCASLAGNECDLLTITDWGEGKGAQGGGGGGSAAGEGKGGGGGGKGAGKGSGDAEGDRGSGQYVDVDSRRAIVVTGRVHPGECQASWMMRGLIDFLVGDSRAAAILRSTFVFKIVPMLNLDGVMLGNNRCSLAGVDLNRSWKKPTRAEHPTIWSAKAMIRETHAKRGVALYCDMHGHSRKKNVFMYGCDDRKRPRPAVRVFPKLLSWTAHGRHCFSFQDCAFAVRKGRECTARVVVAREIGIANTYTLEATYCGPDFGPFCDTHLCLRQLMELGRAVCEAVLDYYVPDPAQRDELHAIAMREIASRPAEQAAAANSSGGRGGGGGGGAGAQQGEDVDSGGGEEDDDVADVADSAGAEPRSSGTALPAAAAGAGAVAAKYRTEVRAAMAADAGAGSNAAASGGTGDGTMAIARQARGAFAAAMQAAGAPTQVSSSSGSASSRRRKAKPSEGGGALVKAGGVSVANARWAKKGGSHTKGAAAAMRADRRQQEDRMRSTTGGASTRFPGVGRPVAGDAGAWDRVASVGGKPSSSSSSSSRRSARRTVKSAPRAGGRL